MPFVAKPLPDRALLNEILDYEPETGLLRWKKALSTSNAKVGSIAGCHSPSQARYVDISIGGQLYKAHRVIWKMMTGNDPEEVDHINGRKSDNRWSNLREANRSQQMRNMRSKLKPLPRGVTRHSNGYRARITIEGKTVALGYFKSVDDAREAYQSASKRLHGSYAFR